MHNSNRNDNSNQKPRQNIKHNHQNKKTLSLSERDELLGNYNVFGDGYFSEDYYMLNKYGQKLVDFGVREYFENNQLISLNKFITELEKHNFEKIYLYKRNTTYNKKESRYSVDWYLMLRDESIVMNIGYDAIKDLKEICFKMDMITAVESVEIEDLEEIFKIAATCTVETEDDQKRYINIVGNTPRAGLTLRKHQIKPPKVPDLDLYYGDNFQKKHQEFVESVNAKNKSGLMIFHGVTGSGKTNYIRYLISQAKPEIDFIFYPITLLREITSPDLITFLSDYQDAVLIIEESEDSVQTRDMFNTDKSSIANLLNVSDGLLSDVLNLKIICTFNTDIRNLDKALLREGRLLGIHHFDKLPAENANEIAQMNKLDRKFDKPVTLAQIYNKPLNEELTTFGDKKGKIGFSKKG